MCSTSSCSSPDMDCSILFYRCHVISQHKITPSQKRLCERCPIKLRNRVFVTRANNSAEFRNQSSLTSVGNIVRQLCRWSIKETRCRLIENRINWILKSGRPGCRPPYLNAVVVSAFNSMNHIAVHNETVYLRRTYFQRRRHQSTSSLFWRRRRYRSINGLFIHIHLLLQTLHAYSVDIIPRVGLIPMLDSIAMVDLIPMVDPAPCPWSKPYTWCTRC